MSEIEKRVMLKRPVTRRVPIVLDHRVEPRNEDLINVTLYPNAVIVFRPYRGRKSASAPLSKVYALLLKAEADERRAAKAATRKRSRKGNPARESRTCGGVAGKR